jgi:chromosome segregation ATPase
MAAARRSLDPSISNEISLMARDMEALTADYEKNEKFANELFNDIELQENMRNMTFDNFSIDDLMNQIIRERQEHKADLYHLRSKIVYHLNEIDIKCKAYQRTLDTIAPRITIMEAEVRVWKDKFNKFEEYYKDVADDARDFSEQIEELIKERDILLAKVASFQVDSPVSPVRIQPGRCVSYEETRLLWEIRDRLKDCKTITKNLYDTMVRYTTDGADRKIGNDDIPTRREKIIKAFENMLNKLTGENRTFPRDEETFKFVVKKIGSLIREDTGKMYITVEMIRKIMDEPGV